MNFKRRSLIMPQLPSLEEIGKITSKRKLQMLLSGLERQTMRVLHEAGWHQAVSMTLSPRVKNRVQVLQELQKEHNELKAKFFEEREALEAKYQKLYVPLYKKRFEIVNGVAEVESNMNKAKEVAEDKDKGDEAKGVPNFWVNAMKANEVLKDEIQEPDERALKYIKDIKWHRVDNPKGFKLQFHFHSNPYFSNSVLAKTYHMVDEDEIPKKAIVTEINWYPGRSLTQKVRYEMPKKDSNRKPVTKTENCRSFFNFFNPPQLPDEAVDLDKNTVSWFTGEAVPAAELEDIGKDYIDVDEYDKEKHIKSLLDAGAKKVANELKRRAAVPKRAPECDLQLKLYRG